MEKEFVPYELALRLNELGFDEKCIMHWWKGKLSYYQMGDFSPTHTSAPIYSQAFRWFREKYKIHVSYGTTSDYHEERNGFVISNYIDGSRNNLFTNWEVGTYEEAELACLEKLIEIIEQKEK